MDVPGIIVMLLLMLLLGINVSAIMAYSLCNVEGGKRAVTHQLPWPAKSSPALSIIIRQLTHDYQCILCVHSNAISLTGATCMFVYMSQCHDMLVW